MPRHAGRSAANYVRSFQVEVPTSQLLELRRRIAAMSLPTAEQVSDRSQGVQLATTRALAKYWLTRYDWRRFEKALRRFPQYLTEIDGVDIHFLHVPSPHPGALPLIVTHGWPGSFVEMLDVIGPLTDPTRYGGRAAEAFHVVVPSIPGFGFSGQPTELGWDTGRVARAWAELMHRLGYDRYVAQGGDVGAGITDAMGRQAPVGLAGIHMNLLRSALSAPVGPTDTDEERAAAAAILDFNTAGSGYRIEQTTRPQTIGYALLDSPIALAAWMLDHDTDSYYKVAGAFRAALPTGNLTRDQILDNITLYWLTGTGASSARVYWESAHAVSGMTSPPVQVPVGFSAFPGEIFQAPKTWVQNVYPTLAYYNQPVRGGHFAAWEEPALFAAEIRAAFRALR
ncbi:epoxide hydrolase family protein [Kribbella sp. NPDC051587]|uniref:epoxide hydrolase family protein n=1 Tax=Kribbella sp. NPDC051587 TaxID=3364119 RepID=UPI00379E848F